MDEDRCPRCAGLVVVEVVAVIERMLPSTDPSDLKRRWWKHKEDPVVMMDYTIVQARCMNCGGVTYLT
jgi:hypothetical protein